MLSSDTGPRYIYHDFETSAVKLSVDNPESKQGLLGFVTLSQQGETNNEENIVKIEWYHDKVKLRSLCTGEEVVVEGVDQEVVIAELENEVVFYFLPSGGEYDGSEDNRYVLPLSECSQADSGLRYLSVTPPDDVNDSVLSSGESIINMMLSRH